MRLVVCGILALAAGCATVPERKPLPAFVLVAHRGIVTEELPENSLASLEETIRRGYTHIEVDVRATKDGFPVCLHDGNLARMCGIDLNIGAVTLAELRERVPENGCLIRDVLREECGRIDSCRTSSLPQAVF